MLRLVPATGGAGGDGQYGPPAIVQEEILIPLYYQILGGGCVNPGPVKAGQIRPLMGAKTPEGDLIGKGFNKGADGRAAPKGQGGQGITWGIALRSNPALGLDRAAGFYGFTMRCTSRGGGRHNRVSNPGLAGRMATCSGIGPL